MKKLALLASLIAPFVGATKAFAQIFINPPERGFRTLGNFISNAVTLVIAFGAIMVLFMLIWGAFEWITSGGDKENVAKARNRILNALIGLAVLAVVFALARFIGLFTGLDITNINVPTPDPSPSGI